DSQFLINTALSKTLSRARIGTVRFISSNRRECGDSTRQKTLWKCGGLSRKNTATKSWSHLERYATRQWGVLEHPRKRLEYYLHQGYGGSRAMFILLPMAKKRISIWSVPIAGLSIFPVSSVARRWRWVGNQKFPTSARVEAIEALRKVRPPFKFCSGPEPRHRQAVIPL